MMGTEMMLKSLGLDPEKIKGSLIEAKNEIMAQVQTVNDSLARIEAKLDALTAQLKGELTDGNNDSPTDTAAN